MNNDKNLIFNNILIHTIANIGDVLLSTSAIVLLRQIYPKAKITIMVRSNVKDIVSNNPVIDEVIFYDYKTKSRSINNMWQMIKILKEKKFDLSISFDRRLRPAILTFFAGIPFRVMPEKVFGEKPSRIGKLYTKVVKINHDLPNTLQAENFQFIIRGMFAQTQLPLKVRPVMAAITAENEEKAAFLLNSLEKTSDTKKIAFCVKGTFPLKNWPQERFANLADFLAKKYPTAIFIIGAPEDREYANQVIALANTKIANFCGETNLVDLAALLKKSDLFITVDTGAAHIGATTDVPIIAIYGCTSPKTWRPMTDKALIFTSNEECCPCSKRAHECLERKCLMNISVEEVCKAAEKLLDGEK